MCCAGGVNFCKWKTQNEKNENTQANGIMRWYSAVIYRYLAAIQEAGALSLGSYE